MTRQISAHPVRRPRRRITLPRAALHATLLATQVLVPAGRLTAQGQREGSEHEDVQRREEYFWMQRSYPSTQRPYEAMARLRLAVAGGTSPARPGIAASTSPLTGGSWRPLGPTAMFGTDNGYFSSGPQLDIGRVTAVAPSATTGGPLLIGTASGGVWRGAADGTSWTATTDDQCSLSIGALSVDPVSPNIVYAAIGEYNIFRYGCGILRSTDGGTSWTLTGANAFLLNGGGSAGFGRLLIDRSTAGSASATTLVAASDVGVYRSTNSGTSWTLVLPGLTASVVALPTKPAVQFAGNSDYYDATRRGLYRSADAGATWAILPLPPGATASSIGRIELATTPAAPDVVFVAIANAQDRKLLGLYSWDDTAGQWTQLPAAGLYTGDSRGDFGAQADYDLVIAVDPADARRIYVAGVRAYRSTDRGTSFSPMGKEIHCDWHAIVIDPKDRTRLYAGTDGGVFTSTDGGDSWASLNAGLAITQYYPGVSVSPQGTMIMGGAQDNGTSVYSGSLVWDTFDGGDGGYNAINYQNPTIRYAESEWDRQGSHIVRNDGSRYSSRNTGIDPTDRGLFIPPLVIDPITPTTLYFATQRLYRTTDEGLRWTALSGDLTRGSGSISTIAVAPSDPQTIYVGTTDGLAQVTRDGGTTFTLVAAGLPNRYVTRIAVDPTDPKHAVLTVSGFGTGHVFETTDAGASWRDISGGLLDAPTNSAAFITGTGTIVVGTDVGTYQTSDDGASWQSGPSGMPNVIVNDLVYAPAANLLVAATYGRGMFASTVGAPNAVLRGDVNRDSHIDAFDALLIQQALVSIQLPTGLTIYPQGDANCNGAIEEADVVLVLRAAVGLPTPNACVTTVR